MNKSKKSLEFSSQVLQTVQIQLNRILYVYCFLSTFIPFLIYFIHANFIVNYNSILGNKCNVKLLRHKEVIQSNFK